jgi:hypothetical protein
MIIHLSFFFFDKKINNFAKISVKIGKNKNLIEV